MSCWRPYVLACALAGCAAHDTSRGPAVPNIVLETQDGRRVHLYDDLVKGRVVTINFRFTTCRKACPGTTANLRKVQQALGDRARDVTMLSISLDPEHDTPATLAEYARVYDVGPGWYLLTGRREQIEALRRHLGVYDPNPTVDADRTRHAGVVVLGNEPIDRWSAVSGLAEPRQIVEAVERVMLAPGDWKPETWAGGRPQPSQCADDVPIGSTASARDSLLAH